MAVFRRAEPVLNVALVEPEIPQNTGNIGRLCLAAGARLHLVHPLGFRVDETAVRRAGLDYWHLVDLAHCESLAALLQCAPVGRRYFLTTKYERPYWDAEFREGDWLVFGRETRGLPESVLSANAGCCLTIPGEPIVRSLNLATAVGIVVYEALRQIRRRQR